jgi:hypothetical protein
VKRAHSFPHAHEPESRLAREAFFIEAVAVVFDEEMNAVGCAIQADAR